LDASTSGGMARRGVSVRAVAFEWERESEAEEDDIVSAVGRKVANDAPLISLLAKLFSPEGVDGKTKGSSYRSYQEFSRKLFEKVTSKFYIATDDLEKQFGSETMGMKGCIYCLWISIYGAGVIERDELLQSCKRLRLSTDLEYFIELFEQQMQEALKKQQGGPSSSRTTASVTSRIDLAVDCICQMLLAKSQATGLTEDCTNSVLDIVSSCFPGTDESEIRKRFKEVEKPADADAEAEVETDEGAEAEDNPSEKKQPVDRSPPSPPPPLFP